MGVHDPYAKRRERKPLPALTEDERFMWDRRHYGREEAEKRAAARAEGNAP